MNFDPEDTPPEGAAFYKLVQVLKTKNAIPTIIVIDGRKYNLDPHGKLTKKMRKSRNDI